MQPLPNLIKNKFFRFLNGEESINDFEQWVYGTDSLERLLGNEDYLYLISLDFSKRDSKYEIEEILRRYINLGEYETWKLKNLLVSFIKKEEHPLQILCEFYKLYCHGHYFLESLGLEYGLSAKVPPGHEHSSGSWKELSDEEQSELIDSLVPGAMREAQKVLSWLEEDKIVITGEQDELGYWLSVDRRAEER